MSKLFVRWALIAAVAGVLITGAYVTFNHPVNADSIKMGAGTMVNVGTENAVTSTENEAVADEQDVNATAAAYEKEAAEMAAQQPLVDKMLMPHKLGSDDAPIKIQEFASLTCGHCAHFYETTLKDLEKQYIDTGKVQLIYNDFPLNAPALDAAMVARCMPEENYFKFIGFLFDTQAKWAYEPDYQQKLRQNSKLLGLDDQAFDECIGNAGLRNGIISKMQEAKDKYNVGATPTFVIDDTITFSGAREIDAFAKVIDERIEAKESLAK